MISFLLNKTSHSVEQVDPQTTVLDYLRDHLGRTGTKEGCASGDCGACTVVLARPNAAGTLNYRSINACITPLGNIHGQQLLTVEDLADGDRLHTAQQAMVDCDGSQCGFCTPGFVMSLYAHYQNYSTADRHQILESLGGNLCRCTGYRPIVDAAVAMYQPPANPSTNPETSDDAAKIAGTLRTLAGEPAMLCEGDRRYFSPTTLEELADLYVTYPDARLVAGGTDLSLEHTQALRELPVIIHTVRVPEICDIKLDGDTLDIGAAASYSRCIPTLVSIWPTMAELLERLGSRQIRNEGTIGGNIGTASPIGDMPPVLLVLGALLVLRKGNASRVLPLEEYFLGYRKTALAAGEFIERIQVPVSDEETPVQVYKISKRLEDDISAVCGAFLLRKQDDVISDIRIAFGGMAEIPKRASHAEAALRGKPLNEHTLNEAVSALEKDFTPLSDFRASSEYRMTTAGNLLRRFANSLAQPSNEIQVTAYA